jgi:hypothetical protein
MRRKKSRREPKKGTKGTFSRASFSFFLPVRVTHQLVGIDDAELHPVDGTQPDGGVTEVLRVLRELSSSSAKGWTTLRSVTATSRHHDDCVHSEREAAKGRESQRDRERGRERRRTFRTARECLGQQEIGISVRSRTFLFSSFSVPAPLRGNQKICVRSFSRRNCRKMT